MSSIFVSYRHKDAASQAEQIYDRLVKRFSSDGVFRDVSSTRPGADFVRVIGRKLDMCDVLLVVIGPRWLQKRDGMSRLDEPGDYVRIEILSALERNIRVIPVLVDGATMPTEEDLPAELHPLARRQALPLDETAWKSGLNQLVRMISEHQRALDAPGYGDGDGEAWNRSAYHPFVGRSSPQPGSSAMEDRTGRGAKELRDAIDISGADGLVAQLRRAGRRPSWPVGLLITVVAAAGVSSGTSPTTAALLLALGLAATMWLALRDLAGRSVVRRYESEDADVRWPESPTEMGLRGPRAAVRRALRARAWRSADVPSERVAAAEAQSHQELVDAWRRLAAAARLRRIARSDRAGPKRRSNAGSGVELCDLVDATAGLEGPGVLVTNIEVPSVVAGDHALYFLPDRLLVREGACFAELSYTALRADWQPMRFAEDEMPRDGERVDRTWERVKRNGERDRRFTANPEWPVMRYGRIEFASETGLRWVLLSSQARAAEGVIEALRSRAKPGSITSVRAADEHRRVRTDSTAA